MNMFCAGLASLAFFVSGADVSAATIDLTDPASYVAGATSTSGIVSGVSWILTAPAGTGPLTYTPFDGISAPDAPLAFELDGVGIGDDEISFGTEFLTLSFDTAVYLTGLHFLDLYGFESVIVWADGSLLTSVGATFGATTEGVDDSEGGYAFSSFLPQKVSSVSFFAGPQNDFLDGRYGNPDFALAGVNVSPVPLPGSAILVLTALSGLSILRRRKALT